MMSTSRSVSVVRIFQYYEAYLGKIGHWLLIVSPWIVADLDMMTMRAARLDDDVMD